MLFKSQLHQQNETGRDEAKEHLSLMRRAHFSCTQPEAKEQQNSYLIYFR